MSPTLSENHEQAEADTSFEIVKQVSDTGVPRKWTVSIALPGSILDNVKHKSQELRTTLACQVARAAAIFCVDEIVVFRECIDRSENEEDSTDDLVHLLSYMDTPQYLRKHLFPVSAKLRNVGLLNPLNLPNHFSRQETPRWRDGVAVLAGRATHQKTPPSKKDNGQRLTRYVDVGLPQLAEVDVPIPMSTRVTVDLLDSGEGYGACPGKYLYGRIVPRSHPRETEGLYWGFSVRKADSLLEALSGGVDDAGNGYDLVIGTSERGDPIRSAVGSQHTARFMLPEFNRALIVFGGVQGLEHSAANDKRLLDLRVGTGEDEAHALADLFDFFLNTCPFQGSRTIRTEEAIPITLAALSQYLRPTSSS